MHAIFNHAIEHAAGLRSYWFRPDAPLRFTAGEYTELYIPHAPHDNRGETRKFTISSSPTEPLISITATSVENGSSFKTALAALQPGDSVYLAETMGEFVLPKDQSIPLAFVAIGAGITPVMSIIAWLHATHEQRHVQIVHATSTQSKLLKQELFREYTPHYYPIVAQPDSTWQGLSGPLTAKRIVQIIDNSTAQRYYLSGPKDTVKALVKQLVDGGIETNDIVTDLFLGIPDEQ